MKERISENKYRAVLLGIVGGFFLLFGFLIYTNISSGSKSRADLTALNGKIEGLQQKYGDPTEENLKILEESVANNIKNGNSLYQQLSGAGIHKLDKTRSATDFGELLKEYQQEVAGILSKGGVRFNEESLFGFEKYSASLIKENPQAIALCLYQQDAFKWLLSGLANVGG